MPIQIPTGAPPPDYTHHALGGWGEFKNEDFPIRNVLYFSTQVSLDSLENTPLIESIAPVREVLVTKDLAFSELLQRDLEDHRVLTGLIPYLMGESTIELSRVGFFPPLLAVVLPFDGDKPAEFPSSQRRSIELFEETDFESLEVPNYFKFSRTVRKLDPNEPISLKNSTPRTDWRNAKLSWNSYNARLVVIDGQHRAMAMLALYRTLSLKGSWKPGADRYKSFYHEEIQRLYRTRKLPKVEIPVTVCIFPGLLESAALGASVHKVARNLFVDVNKEAKPPNPSRLILLSESSLTDMFTRTVLDELRDKSRTVGNASVLPLFGIEYDTPSGRKAMTVQRKTCVTSIEKLKHMVTTVVRHRKYLKSIDEFPKRHGPGTDDSLRDQLRLSEDDDDHFVHSSGERFKKNDLKDDHFPSWAFDDLREKFLQLHGRPIIRLLSEVQPYSSVRDALLKFEENWQVIPGEVHTLAKESICDGVGTYWTIKHLSEVWEDKLKLLPADIEKEERKKKPGVVVASEIIDEKEAEYRRLLEGIIANTAISTTASAIPDETPETPTPAEIEAVRSLLAKAETAAVQMGLVAAYAGLVIEFQLAVREAEQFLTCLIDRLNRVSTSRSNKGVCRMFVFADSSPDDLRVGKFFPFGKLEPRRWAHMRWIWLELFFTAAEPFADDLTALVGSERLESARSKYVKHGRKALFKESLKDELKNTRGMTPIEKEQKRTSFITKLEASYLDWFDEFVTYADDDEQSRVDDAANEDDEDDDAEDEGGEDIAD